MYTSIILHMFRRVKLWNVNCWLRLAWGHCLSVRLMDGSSVCACVRACMSVVCACDRHEESAAKACWQQVEKHLLTVDWLHSLVFVLFVCRLTPTVLPLPSSLPHLSTSTSFFLYDSPSGSSSLTLPHPPHLVLLISCSSPHLFFLISSSSSPHFLPPHPPISTSSSLLHLVLLISSLSRCYLIFLTSSPLVLLSGQLF